MLLVPNDEQAPWGQMRWLATGADVGASLAIMTISPGATSPRHRHGNCDEVLHVLKGRISERIEEKWIPVAAGETIIVKAGAAHQTHNPDTVDAEIIIAYSTGEREYEELAE